MRGTGERAVRHRSGTGGGGARHFRLVCGRPVARRHRRQAERDGRSGARRGRFMADFRIVGSDLRWNGILRNTLYRGEITFNRMVYRRTPTPAAGSPAASARMGPCRSRADCRRRCFRGRAGDCRGPGGAPRRAASCWPALATGAPRRAPPPDPGLAFSRRKETGRVAPCSPGVRTVRFTSAAARGGCHACPASKTCANRGRTIGLTRSARRRRRR